MIQRLWSNITTKTNHHRKEEEDDDSKTVQGIDNMMRTIDLENTENLEVFNTKLNNKYQRVPMYIISAIATKRLFDCYTDKEIGEVLHYFGQIKEKERRF